MSTTTSLQLYEKLSSLHQQKSDIEKQISQIQHQLKQINISDSEHYVGKCFKQTIENDVDINMEKTIYYKILSVNKDNPYSFWTLVLKLPLYEENLKHTTINYISKKDINFLGQKKFFLRQLTPISEEEFIEAIDSVYDHLIDINSNVTNKKVEHFELKCPNCDSIGPLINLYPNIIDVQYTCEKCGCKYITKFQHGCICDVTPITEFK